MKTVRLFTLSCECRFFLLTIILLGYLLFYGGRQMASSDDGKMVVHKNTTTLSVNQQDPLKGTRPRAHLVRIPLPITGNVERRLIAQVRSIVSGLQKKRSQPNSEQMLILEFDSSISNGGLGSEFEDCLKIARYLISPSLNGIKTVAYLPQPLKGHALLVVMACDQVIMAPESSITGIDESQGANDPTIRGSYLQIAESRKTFPQKITEGLIDPERKLLRVQTDQGNAFVFADKLKEFERTRTIDDSQTETIFSGGETASLTARQARNAGVVSRLAQNQLDLAVLLGLSKKDLKIDPLSTDVPLRPRMILMDSYVDSRFTETRISMIDRAVREEDINFVCLWIDQPDGDPVALSQFADFLSALNPKQVRTVAYIPTMARGIIPLVALACDDIVMHRESLFGGKTDSLSSEERTDILALVNDLIVPRKLRDKALSNAMFDPDSTVYIFRNPRTGAVQYLTETEWNSLANREQWRRESKLTTDGKTLQLTGEQAEDLGVARATVSDFAELKTMYGLEGEPDFSEPSWANHMVGILSSPSLAWLLVLFGLAGIYAELQLPGIGIGGFIATVAFTIYFWSNFMNHTANELEIVLFLVGVTCLILEIFIIPGFGIFGLGGGILMLIALILASQTFVFPQSDSDLRQFRNSLMTVGVALAGLTVFIVASRRLLPQTPLLSRLILSDQVQGNEQDLHENAAGLGAVGQAVTDLRPSGKAAIMGKLVDVLAEGEWIANGTPIIVTEIHGTRIVVKSI